MFTTLQYLLLAVSSVIIYGIYSSRRRHPLDNIPGPKPKSWLLGTLPSLYEPDSWQLHEDIARSYGPVARIDSLMGEKQLYLSDPRALYHIYVKAPEVFQPTKMFLAFNEVIFGPGLLSTDGNRHRKQRKLVTPGFALTHLRNLTRAVYDVTHKMRDVFLEQVKEHPQEIDLHHWFKNLALELIGVAGFGHSFDALSEAGMLREDTRSVQEMMAVATPLVPLVMCTSWTFGIGPPSLRKAIVSLIPLRRVQQLREMIDTIHKMAQETFAHKKEPSKGTSSEELKDILDALIQDNVAASQDEKISDTEIIAQISTLLFAGMDTSSALLARIIHLLTLYPEVQERLREEITNAYAQSDEDILPYDTVMKLPYLDGIYRETLRLYPPVPVSTRRVMRNTFIPLSKPIKRVDGTIVNEIFVPKETNVTISILNANRNPAIWGDDALEWNPERKVPQGESLQNPGLLPNLMTFIVGPRSCIGFKFAEMSTKIALVTLLSKLKFENSGKDIEWAFSMVYSPVVHGEDRPALPILIRRS